MLRETRVEGVGGYVTTRACARMLGVSTDTVLWRVKTYNVPCLRLGRSLLISLDDLRRSFSEPPRLVTGE